MARASLQQRIDYLDGLRGIAIISVLVFHAYVNDPAHLPFGDRFNVLPLRLGWQGVELFFLISGFVIFMTLEKCSSLAQFAWRRWARLFPAMLVVSALIFSVEQRHLKDLIPGITFVSPSLINSVTGIQTESLSGVFWSLYVEVTFYVIFGTLYFVAGPRWAIACIFALFSASIASSYATSGVAHSSLAWRLSAASRWIGFAHFGWFASGALFYLFIQQKSKPMLLAAVAAGVLAALTSDFAMAEKVGLVLVVALFCAAITLQPLQECLSWKPLVFVGVVSYPLYLVHFFILKNYLWVAADALNWLPPTTWPLPLFLISLLIAWIVHKFIETPVLKVSRSFESTKAATA